MQYKKLIQSEIDFTRMFSLIAQAYEEIAVMKMRKVRDSVLATREYLSKLSEIFFELKKAKSKLKQQEALKKKSSEKFPLEKLPKTVSVLLSANTTLYGDLIGRIFKLFMKNVTLDGSDLIIVGRVGRRLYELQEKKKPYIYFELPDVEIRLEELKALLYHLVKYQNIMVYYGKFESVVTQIETVSNITGDKPFAYKEDLKAQVSEDINFLFEPSLDVILAFFEDLIASSLFRQTVHEIQLARWASRIMSMERAQVNIESELKKLHQSQIKIQRLEQNRKQLERLAGLSLWRR